LLPYGVQTSECLIQGQILNGSVSKIEQKCQGHFQNTVLRNDRHFSTSPFSSEVDFILGDHTAGEVKAKENVSACDLKSLRAFAEEKKLKRYLCVSLEPRRRNLENLTILPLREFLEALWSREYSS
jgi:hypothetical protein